MEPSSFTSMTFLPLCSRLAPLRHLRHRCSTIRVEAGECSHIAGYAIVAGVAVQFPVQLNLLVRHREVPMLPTPEPFHIYVVVA